MDVTWLFMLCTQPFHSSVVLLTVKTSFSSRKAWNVFLKYSNPMNLHILHELDLQITICRSCQACRKLELLAHSVHQNIRYRKRDFPLFLRDTLTPGWAAHKYVC